LTASRLFVRDAQEDAGSISVMTTLSQGDLPLDSGILRTAAQQNNVMIAPLGQAMPSVGVYAKVHRRHGAPWGSGPADELTALRTRGFSSLPQTASGSALL